MLKQSPNSVNLAVCAIMARFNGNEFQAARYCCDMVRMYPALKTEYDTYYNEVLYRGLENYFVGAGGVARCTDNNGDDRQGMKRGPNI